MAVSRARLAAAIGLARDAANLKTLRHVEFQLEHAGPLDRVKCRQIERELFRLQPGLDQRIDGDPRRDLLDGQFQLERHGGIAIGEGPGAPSACARRKFVGIDLQQAAGLGRLGPQARADLGHDETLLAADVQGLDHGHVERLDPAPAGSGLALRRSSPIRRPRLRGLGRLEQLGGDLLHGRIRRPAARPTTAARWDRRR